MKKITIKWLTEKNACCSEEDKATAQNEFNGDIFKIIPFLIEKERFSDANWLITKYMTKTQNIKYAIFAAEQVLHIFEDKYPNDLRPRKAIEAAKQYLKSPNKKAAAAADDAAAAAAAADDAAADAAYAAAAAAAAADDDAAYAAYAAAAAAADDDAAAIKKEMRIKILKNGLNILK